MSLDYKLREQLEYKGYKIDAERFIIFTGQLENLRELKNADSYLILEHPAYSKCQAVQFCCGYDLYTSENKTVVLTHSDLFFYGLRCAIKDKRLSPKDVLFVHYSVFPRSILSTVSIDEDGKLGHCPPGFFLDQVDKALRHLL